MSNRSSRTDKQAKESSEVDKTEQGEQGGQRPTGPAKTADAFGAVIRARMSQRQPVRAALSIRKRRGEGGGDDRLNDDGRRSRGGPGPGGPIRGEGFREWTDRMRDVEELLDNPDMRSEAARIRDRVRGEREITSDIPKSPIGTN